MSRKRAHRRAKRRAEQAGGTWYRGSWHSAVALGVAPTTGRPNQPTATVKSPPCGRARPRLKVMSYNIGGFTSEVYDTFVDWLDTRCQADLVLVQETHWGLGKEERRWLLPNWLVISSPNAGNRYSGVAVFARRSVFEDNQMSHVIWIPGRLLHVRYDSPRAKLDIVVGYQTVRQKASDVKTQQRRHAFWTKLGLLLQGIPARNVLVLGADLNTACRPLPGLNGRGVLKATRSPDEELEELQRVSQLVTLNTWGRANPGKSRTFENGETASQIDFVCTWRHFADTEARQSCPLALDLVPWRNGPKHFPVMASIPWIQGWKLRAKRVTKPGISKRDLLQAIQHQHPSASELRVHLTSAIVELGPNGTIEELNTKVLPVCQRLFPSRRKPTRHAQSSADKQVKQCIDDMWHAHSRLAVPGPRMSFMRCAEVVRRRATFQAASKALKAASKMKRREWFDAQLERAEHAASRHDLSAVYAVINILAPKRKVDKVRIRSEQGHLLSVEQEFRDIYSYFQTAFSREVEYSLPDCPAPLVFSEEEIWQAIRGLKGGKAVPSSSLPADVWKMAPVELSNLCMGIFNRSSTEGNRFPSETTDCQLTLLPKPGKQSRRPKDLRPLGIQDPSSKVLANVLKARVLEEIGPFLLERPQFAYCPGKAIDGALSRVAAHCTRVRERLQQGSLSVHARREGQRTSGSFGGLMLSLDMSRAFDEIPRRMLEKALVHAGLSDELCHAILSLHEQCKYEVRHEAYTGVFDMKRGVRQGCSLAPLLFAVFSCWIYDVITLHTDSCWADRLMTLFADDSHLAFEIETLEDLISAQRIIRTVFKVLKDSGMQLNPSKSRVVLGLRGSAARRWIRKHTCYVDGSPVLSLGTPAEPLLIPQVPSMVYLGIVVSYTRFEMQTLAHRIQAAMHNRQRLLKLLHSKRIAVKSRVRLYAACIRSTLFYGLHAVGLPEDVLRRVDAFDSRSLRAISNSPAHLTHETTIHLRKRLGIQSPRDYFLGLLQRRVQRSGDPASRERFQAILLMLEQTDLPSAAVSEEVPLMESGGVACRVCGQIFINSRIMRSHKARKHKLPAQPSPSPPTATAPQDPPHKPSGEGVLAATTYNLYATDGMPTCRLCGATFTRVEGLKKHINRGCKVLDTLPVASEQTALGEDPTQVEVKVASAGEELGETQVPTPHGVHPAVIPDADRPLLQVLEFQQALEQGWRSVLQKPSFCSSLSQYCAVCHQWISTVGPGCKQHYRTMHAQEYALAADAVARASSLGLVPVSPCRYCGRKCLDPRKHLKGCVPVFQASLAGLVHASRPKEDEKEKRAAVSRQELMAVFGAKPTEAERDTKAAEGQEEEDRRRMESSEAALGAGQEQAKVPITQIDQKLQHWVTTMTRAMLRHESDLALYRADTGFVIFVDTGAHSCLQQLKDASARWQEMYTQGKVTSSLKHFLMPRIFKTLRESMEALQTDDAKAARCKEAGWVIEGTTAMNPAWKYHVWDPQQKKEIQGPTDPRTHMEILQDLDVLQTRLMEEGVLLQFKTTKDLETPDAEVIPFLATISLRSQAAQETHFILSRLVGCACCKLVGIRIKPQRGNRTQMSRQVEQAYLAVDFCEWSNRDPWSRGRA
ncbi:unnamed protein product [Symbiodinium sp. CCMP2592]|nr:unnamed protein product [Symbiodinium sp. CCMP2592]